MFDFSDIVALSMGSVVYISIGYALALGILWLSKERKTRKLASQKPKGHKDDIYTA